MSNPKKFGDASECGGNRYTDSAKGRAAAFAGWGPGAPPLAPAALAALQAAAGADAARQANAQMNAIYARGCPRRLGCGIKHLISRDIVGPAQMLGPPKLVARPRFFVQALLPVAGGGFALKTIIDITVYEWVQDAEQDYEILFECLRPEDG